MKQKEKLQIWREFITSFCSNLSRYHKKMAFIVPRSVVALGNRVRQEA